MERVEDGQAALTGRLEAISTRMDERLDRMERDVAKGEFDRQAIIREIGALRTDVQANREVGQRLPAQMDTVARDGVKQAAAAGSASTWSLIKKSWTMRLLGLSAILMAMMSVVEAVPKLVVTTQAIWQFLASQHEVAK